MNLSESMCLLGAYQSWFSTDVFPRRSAPGILCCCGEATPALVGTALSNGHRIPTEEAWVPDLGSPTPWNFQNFGFKGNLFVSFSLPPPLKLHHFLGRNGNGNEATIETLAFGTFLL